MARPKKFNADYFSHDADMRNDLRIKAIRTKFGLEGYAIYCMLLEVMTDHDYFQIDFTELEQELIAGDFGISAEKLNEVVDFIIRLDLFQMSETRLKCQKLSERLDSVLVKRRNSSKRGVTVTETTQSKVKESKGDENKEILIERFNKWWTAYKKKGSKKQAQEQWLKLTIEEMDQCVRVVFNYVNSKDEIKFQKDAQRYLRDKAFNDLIVSNGSKAAEDKVNFAPAGRYS